MHWGGEFRRFTLSSDGPISGDRRLWAQSRAVECDAHLGLTILSLAGRLIQSWKPHRSPSVPFGISECTMPRPAVIHCTPPGPITPCEYTQ